MSLRYLPSSLGSIRVKVWKEMSFEEFQDVRCSSHLGCRNETNLTILNLHVFSMPPTKFQLNPTYRLGADVVRGFSSWSPWWSSWVFELNELSNSKCLCHPNAFHHVLAHSDGSRRSLKSFKMATVAGILNIGTKRF